MFCSKIVAEPDKLNRGTSDEISVAGYETDSRRVALTVVLGLLTGGLLLLLLTWKPSIRLWFTHSPCDLHHATRILCTDIYGQEWDEEVVDPRAPRRDRGTVYLAPSVTHLPRYFINKNIKYAWDYEAFLFTRLRSQESISSLHYTYNGRDGLNNAEAQQLFELHGENFIKIEVLSVLEIILQQIRNPFYVFQLYTIILWSLQQYYVFAVCIGLLSVLSIACSVWETKRQSKTLREKMTTQSEVYVMRNNIKTLVSSRALVPGDAVVVEAGVVLEVDLLLVDGAVVVSEAVLTGESVPITKVGVADSELLQQQLDYTLHKRHLLYSGSEVMQVRGSSQVLGVVVNTGFSTVRGELVRSILFPKPIAFYLYTDFLKMLFVFIGLGLVSVGWSIYTWLNSEPPAPWEQVVFNSLDLITFVIPPILPATMTAINVWAQRRLKQSNIFCLSSNYVSLAGPVDVACFDKTGTLTEEELELAGAIACGEDGRMGSPVEQLDQLPEQYELLRMALASCHTLTAHNTVQMDFTKNLLGHPMDLKIFNNLNWELEERDGGCINVDYGMSTPVLLRPSDGPGEIAQLKVYPFDSRDQRMTVVTITRFTNRLLVLMKGAPELLADMCDPKSVPENFDQVLTWYTLQGLRVLALAGVEKKGPWQQLSDKPRDVLEEGAKLLGLVLFYNPLKADTGKVLKLIQHADIQTTMITGDNLATAISVARECGLVKSSQRMLIVRAQLRNPQQLMGQRLRVTYHETLASFMPQGDPEDLGHYTQEDKEKEAAEERLAASGDVALVMDGHTWQLVREHERSLLPTLAYKGRVFARMKPDQKVQVIEELRELGHQVAMCGDGCNDCGALSAAHVGVSLAATEASVAAPFTSTQQSIECVHTLIREGRATLVSTYASFKYNISYGFASLMIVLMHFSIQAEPSDTQYLIMDLVLITVPSLVLGNTCAPDMLVPQRPTTRILHPLHITSILSFLVIQGFAYWLCWIFTYQQPWFEPYVYVPGRIPSAPCYENTALVIFSFYTFIIGAVVFSHAEPFRRQFYTNYILTAYLLLATTCVMVFTFCTNEGFNAAFNFRTLPHQGFRWVLLMGAIINVLVCYMWERWVLYGVVFNTLMPWLEGVLPPRLAHQKLEQKLSRDPDWPPTIDAQSNRSSYNSYGRSDSNQPTTNNDKIDSDDDTHAQVLMMRKLSRRGRFKATVKYVEKPTTKRGGANLSPNKLILTMEDRPPVFMDESSEGDRGLLQNSNTLQGNVAPTLNTSDAADDMTNGGDKTTTTAAYGLNPSRSSFDQDVSVATYGVRTSPSAQRKPLGTFASTGQERRSLTGHHKDGEYTTDAEPIYSKPADIHDSNEVTLEHSRTRNS